jgi:hypothetical protein
MIGHVVGSGERDHGPSESIKCKNFLNSQRSTDSQEEFYPADLIMKVTNKMLLRVYRLIYFLCQLYMFRVMFSSIIRST